MISIENQTIIYRRLHNIFRIICPVAARCLNLKRWEGDIWHYLTTPRWKKKIILVTNDGLKMEVRTNHLVDLTAVFGRPEEKDISTYIQNLPNGGTFIDAGAHIGRYTLKAAKAVGSAGRVIAFEPDGENCRLLHDNCSINDYDWVEVEQYALGSENGSITLISGNDAATNTILPDWYEKMQPADDINFAKQIEVSVRRLDDILDEKEISSVDLMKVDVEGAEMQLFNGVTRSLKHSQIKSIICEVHSPVVTMREVVQFLEHYNYKLKVIGSSEIYAKLL